MQVDLFEMMKSQLETTGVQLLFLSAPYDNFPDFDYRFFEQTFADYDYGKILNRLKQLAKPGTLIHFHEFMWVQYSFFAFPDWLREEYGYEACLIGPIMFEPISFARFRSFIDAYQVPAEHYQNVQEFFNRIPVLPSSDIWFANLTPFFKALLGDALETLIADDALTEFFPSNYSEHPVKPTEEVSLSALDARYQAENDFLKMVAAGNIDESMNRYYKFTQFKLTPRAADPIRDAKNLNITLNTLLRKTVESVSVHPYHIDSLSAQFAVQIENCTSLNQLNTLSRTMIRKYCILVKNYSRKGYSALVQLSMDHIDTHYNEELSLDSLAKLCGVTNSYLSALFKKETGMNITDYIHTTRIRQALVLLNSTNMTVRDIALQCGYEDSNYFTRIFKKYQGLSPKDYRSQFF